jgi:hypothetical protein
MLVQDVLRRVGALWASVQHATGPILLANVSLTIHDVAAKSQKRKRFLPKQSNHVDCGVYALVFIDSLLLGRRPDRKEKYSVRTVHDTVCVSYPAWYAASWRIPVS